MKPKPSRNSTANNLLSAWRLPFDSIIDLSGCFLISSSYKCWGTSTLNSALTQSKNHWHPTGAWHNGPTLLPSFSYPCGLMLGCWSVRPRQIFLLWCNWLHDRERAMLQKSWRYTISTSIPFSCRLTSSCSLGSPSRKLVLRHKVYKWPTSNMAWTGWLDHLGTDAAYRTVERLAADDEEIRWF